MSPAFFGEAARRGWAADLLIFRGCGVRAESATSLLSFWRHRRSRVRARSSYRPSIRGRRSSSPAFRSAETCSSSIWASRAATSRRECVARRRSRFRSTWSGALDTSRLDSRASTIAISCARCERRRSQNCWRFPGLFEPIRLEGARSIYEFDDAVTAPVHGFADAHDYYTRSSSLAGSIEFGGQLFS